VEFRCFEIDARLRGRDFRLGLPGSSTAICSNVAVIKPTDYRLPRRSGGRGVCRRWWARGWPGGRFLRAMGTRVEKDATRSSRPPDRSRRWPGPAAGGVGPVGFRCGLFGEVLEDGGLPGADRGTIRTPDAVPAPRPDLRRILVSVGPWVCSRRVLPVGVQRAVW